MKLSIVVPVYNVASYLCRCVDSLLDQGNFDDYEILLIDDGSTDESGKICDSYETRHSFVRVIHKENGGLSSARNVGIENAQGKYLLFVDSDDYFRPKSLQKLMEAAEELEIDILCFNYLYCHDSYSKEVNNIVVQPSKQVLTGELYMTEALNQHTMQMSVWKNLYRQDLIVENQLLFFEGHVHEDEEWTPRVFVNAKRVAQYPEVLYAYYIRDNSITGKNNQNRAARDLLAVCKRLKDYCNDIVNLKTRNALEDHIGMLALSAFYQMNDLTYVPEIQGILNGLHLKGKNKKKNQLFHYNPALYLSINEIAKATGHFASKIKSSFQILKKLKQYSTQEIHRFFRKHTISKKQRVSLTNHSFSILCSTCNGGVITSELGEQFRTPTVNLWMNAEDFLKFVKRLDYYLLAEVEELQYNFETYPVGRVNDITLYFMHYHTFEEAKNKWNERKKRIRFDDLYLLMAEKNGCTADMVHEFDSLPYKNKAIFTAHRYPDCMSAVFVDEDEGSDEVGIMTDFVGVGGRKYDRYFDYVKWLNGEGNHV